MGKILVITLSLLFLASFAYAEDAKEDEVCSYMAGKLSLKVGAEIPGYMPYGNEVMNIYTPDGSAVGHIITKDKKIYSFGCNLAEDPTYNIFISGKQAVDDIVSSESPASEVNRKLHDGSIRIEGQKFTKKVKMFFSKIGLTVASWFD